MIFDNGGKTFNSEEGLSLQNSGEKTGSLYVKEWWWNFILQIKINSKWNIYIYDMKPQTSRRKYGEKAS